MKILFTYLKILSVMVFVVPIYGCLCLWPVFLFLYLLFNNYFGLKNISVSYIPFIAIGVAIITVTNAATVVSTMYYYVKGKKIKGRCVKWKS